jgi:hypothetical protein
MSPADSVPHANIRTRGVDLQIRCPQCDSVKIWYTSDPVNRAFNQLLDSLVTAFVERLVPMLGQVTQRMRSKGAEDG